MQYQEASKEIASYREQIGALRQKLKEVQGTAEPQEVEDYVFQTLDGDVALSALFGDHEHLFVIHNMGQSCPYCTLWADGFNGVTGHLENRASFVVTSPDAPAEQQAFKDSRDWRFRMVSHHGTGFAEDMGYTGEHGWMPGVSVFKKMDGKIVRVSDAHFGPGDDFCGVWHLFDLIPDGPDGWQPKYKY